MNSEMTNSELNRLIPPEIKNDEFYAVIQKIAREEDIKTVLEIGSSSGGGSTEAFVTGLRDNSNKPTLFCMEVSKTRFTELAKNYENDSFVKCYNVSSVSLEQFPDEKEVIEFYNTTQTNLNLYPLEQVLGWLRQDIEYVQNFGDSTNGIQKIKQENNINLFDLVLIDGSEFTGNVELDDVYGAKLIFLDDINTFKNYKNHHQLLADKNYTLVVQNASLRNGYSIFKIVDVELKNNNYNLLDNNISVSSLPIHFFTIVLNGQPFIRYHIEIFKKLPFKWHWHIVEGVADLKNDTAWSLRNGGRISDEIHHNGCSNDGTTEYLDQLAELEGDHVTIYRQPEGIFWDGKREMVNAPLANIQEECLLWQVDVDELWTVEQLCTARQMFINNPDKTAAFYWCWYFVGENLVISTRNCYTQNPQQEWLRTWKFQPGAFWAAHEPPILVESLPDGQLKNVAAFNPFVHEETEKLGLIFQHFAYVTKEQLKFKEEYYGYQNAIAEWEALQKTNKFPVFLSEYFSWVGDNTQVNTVNSCGIIPIAQKEYSGNNWQFLQSTEISKVLPEGTKVNPIILVDGVFFQLYQTGIARVWKSLLQEWVNNDFRQHIVVIDRAGTAPKISGLKYRLVPAYDYSKTDADKDMLQQVCDEEGADLFISSYYTTPLTTPSVFLAHDMIPELMGWNLQNPMWQEKHYGIQHASAYIAVSENTARDLVKCFPEISLESVKIALNGVNHQIFSTANPEDIHFFKIKYGISKPYFILVGPGGGYKNSILFFQGFAQLVSKQGFDIVCTGGGGLLEPAFREYTFGCTVHMLQLSDEELAIAYSGAVALVYPSKYEGFGMPIAEAMACGCPVITCPNASLPEVAGKAAIYVKDDDFEAMTNALCEVQKPRDRNSLIAAGLEQAKQFSWRKMAEAISSALIETTLQFLNLKEINLIIFPDWLHSEEVLIAELERVITILIKHPESQYMTLIIDTSNSVDNSAEFLLSAVSMNIMMQEDTDISEGLEISFVRRFGDLQWQTLLPHIQAKIPLEYEDKYALVQANAESLPVLDLEDNSFFLTSAIASSKQDNGETL
jgi:glycosyltransferase involved in cell wall biosynthesis